MVDVLYSFFNNIFKIQYCFTKNKNKNKNDYYQINKRNF